MAYGPLGGDVQSLAIDPRNPGTFFAGTGNGGVFRSTDDGKSWRAVNEGLPCESITALAIDLASSGTLLAATDATFRVIRTGQTLLFEKAPGLYLGFADNGTLRF